LLDGSIVFERIRPVVRPHDARCVKCATERGAITPPTAYRHGRAGYGSLGRELIGMAPDGVASVELRFRDGSRRVAAVDGDVWLVTAPHSSERARAVIWRDAQGRVLRRLR
jgi:hypothetical protein